MRKRRSIAASLRFKSAATCEVAALLLNPRRRGQARNRLRLECKCPVNRLYRLDMIVQRLVITREQEQLLDRRRLFLAQLFGQRLSRDLSVSPACKTFSSIASTASTSSSFAASRSPAATYSSASRIARCEEKHPPP